VNVSRKYLAHSICHTSAILITKLQRTLSDTALLQRVYSIVL